ncbi:hypothetical protein KWH83_02660, partial [Morganella morganii]|nr:hypothetical protein [Morganella morganii]
MAKTGLEAQQTNLDVIS